MRKIKITALLLAVLMVVTAFAGCASKSTVTNLDNKVNDLDNKIQEQADALAGIQDSLKDISDAIGSTGSSSELDDIKADVEANKQSVADILAAIESLKDAVAGATGEDEDVKKAISQAGAKIDALKGAYEDNKVHYTAETFAEIREILGDAQASISACVTADAVATVLAAMETELAAHKAVNDALYEYVVALEGNITDKSADKVAEAMEALADAEEFYTKAGKMEALTDYEVDDETIDLVEAIEDLNVAQTVELPKVKLAAKELVKKIDKASAAYNESDLYNLLVEYKTWTKAAKKLSAENVALVTNYDKLTAALESAQNVQMALRDFNAPTWWYPSMLDATYGEDMPIFHDFVELGEYALVLTYDTQNAKGDTVKARTIEIYKAIDARLAAFKAEYELNDAALEYIVGEDFLEIYEACKALVESFEAEYKKLVDGAFSAIKDMNSKKLSAANALELVNAYKKNAADIDGWKNELVAAYKDAYKKNDNALLNVDEYAIVVKLNFNAMVEEAGLGVYEYNDLTKKYDIHTPYADGFDTTTKENAYYLKLYDFGRTKNDALETFLTVTFPAANDEATMINNRIKAFKENQQSSIVALVTGIGGYVALSDDETMLVAIDSEYFENFAGVADTIAEFNAKYEKYDLSGMIDTATYDAKLATIEKNVENAEKALKALVDAYNAVLAGKDTVVVTMDNVAEIEQLKGLLEDWYEVGRTDMVKAVVDNTTVTGVEEYELSYILDTYTDDRDAYYENVLKATDFSKTKVDGSVDTGAIVRLIYQAQALKKEATAVADLYKAMKALYDADKAAFEFDALNKGLAAFNSVYDGSCTNAEMYGIKSMTSTTASGETTWTIKYVSLHDTNDRFQEMTETVKVTNDKTEQAALKKFVSYLYGSKFDTAEAAVAYLFGAETGSLQDMIKTTDFTDLDLGKKAIPTFMMPILAMYLEAKFEINNMGQEYEPIETAKAGWATEGSEYGFSYIKAMTVAQLRYNDTVHLDEIYLNAINQTENYEELRVAVNSRLEKTPAWDKDIIFGGADYTWLANSYDINDVIYADGSTVINAVDTADYVAAYDAHDIAIKDLEVAVLPIYVIAVEDNCSHVAPTGTHCAGFTCTLCGAYVEGSHDVDASSIQNVEILSTDNGTKAIPFAAYYEVYCLCSKCVADGSAFIKDVTERNIVYTDVDTNGTISDTDTVVFEVELNGTPYIATSVRGNGTWTTTVVAK